MTRQSLTDVEPLFSSPGQNDRHVSLTNLSFGAAGNCTDKVLTDPS